MIIFCSSHEDKNPPLVNGFAAIYDNVWLIGEDKTLNPKKVPVLIFLQV